MNALKVFGDYKTEGQVIFYPCPNSLCVPRPPHHRGLTITLRHITVIRTHMDSEQPDAEVSN